MFHESQTGYRQKTITSRQYRSESFGSFLGSESVDVPGLVILHQTDDVAFAFARVDDAKGIIE